MIPGGRVCGAGVSIVTVEVVGRGDLAVLDVFDVADVLDAVDMVLHNTS